MKTNLAQNIQQHVGLTPQLQQAFRLMQLSSAELHNEIIKNITDNPLLESQSDSLFASYDDSISTEPEQDINNDENVVDEFIILANMYAQNIKRLPQAILNYYPEITDNSLSDLRNYLRWQLNFAKLSDKEYAIASFIIDEIDDDGFYAGQINDLQNHFSRLITRAEINAVFKLIQNFDPGGVGSQNLREFLLFQIAHMPEQTQTLELAKQLITHDLEILAKHDYKSLCKKYHIPMTRLHEIIDIIVNLKTTPNDTPSTENLAILLPDIICLCDANGEWELEANHGINQVKLNDSHLKTLQNLRNNPQVRQYLKLKLKEAKWFLQCLANREKTLLLVCQAMMQYQKDFLTQGSVALKPLTLQQISTMTDLHESTVSRLIANKSIATPRGVFPLRYFLSSHVTQTNGARTSSKKVFTLIKTLVSAEPPGRPLSDQQIANRLQQDHNLCVARRTIAKYREVLGILPAKFRKRWQGGFS